MCASQALKSNLKPTEESRDLTVEAPPAVSSREAAAAQAGSTTSNVVTTCAVISITAAIPQLAHNGVAASRSCLAYASLIPVISPVWQRLASFTQRAGSTPSARHSCACSPSSYTAASFTTSLGETSSHLVMSCSSCRHAKKVISVARRPLSVAH